jgi:hypothetical protein
VTGAGPIFHSVMLAAERRATYALSDVPDRSIVPAPHGVGGVESREVCALSGMSANPWCPARRNEWMPTGAEDLPCSWHHFADGELLTILPAEYSTWEGAPERSTAARLPASSRSQPRSLLPRPALAIASPPDGATYLIDPTLRREFQSLPLRVTTANPTRVAWSVNGARLGEAPSDVALSWPLAPGTHRITARDSMGREASAMVVVR